MNDKTKTMGEGQNVIKGIVTPRKCNCCGHHEIGIVADDGKYIPLKPGMKIIVEELLVED